MPRRPDRQVFVGVDWLAEHLQDDDLRIIDARYVPPNESPQGEEMYEAGHIPGATFVHWRRDAGIWRHGAGGVLAAEYDRLCP